LEYRINESGDLYPLIEMHASLSLLKERLDPNQTFLTDAMIDNYSEMFGKWITLYYGHRKGLENLWIGENLIFWKQETNESLINLKVFASDLGSEAKFFLKTIAPVVDWFEAA
jgi:hypothetical protein